jgi:5-methylcytosine-specific restriction endonuclease McrA
MRRFTRLEEPASLKGKSEDIGRRYAERRLARLSYRFQWPADIYEEVRQTCLAQTDAHCSYCDGFPLGQGDETIDHFKPKTDERFYHLVAHWPNLYLACNDCQRSKMTEYAEDLLRPDSDGYNFSDYFVYNFNTMSSCLIQPHHLHSKKKPEPQ